MESDIDVAAVCHDTFMFENLTGFDERGDLGIGPAVLETALARRFRDGMSAGDKAFNVHENTYRLEADVTPFFEYRLYRRGPSNSVTYDEGVKSISRSGIAFVNWHKDHYREGVARNLATGGRFKRVTRIFKNTRFDMVESGTSAARSRKDSVILVGMPGLQR